jgi:tRNA (cytidine/uridine-2'-O-)-methyltransferase
VWDVELRRGDHMVFGKETAGLPGELLERYKERLVTLPMVEGERSLNVATAVCAAVYEGMRQVGEPLR